MVGECGLDYDRFEYASKEDQLLAFAPHFDLAQKHKLPMYLHSRSTGQDFNTIVRENRHKFTNGVVHSYTGTLPELKELLELDLYIGLNGCSLKTEQNCMVAKEVPLDRLMIETDCPYCDIRNSHYSSQFIKTVLPRKDKAKYKPENGEFCIVKDRNEPCMMIQVVEVLAELKGISTEELCQHAWANSLKLFGLSD